jgi:diguanylate cyclase (GGDEF)-like protein
VNTLAGKPTRVVLVGRTGLEHDLRREPGVELARARTVLDAVGEFAEISEPDDRRPATIIVGPGSLANEPTEAFVQALRKIDADVRVVGMGDLNGAAALFDAVLPAQANMDALRRALSSDSTSSVSASATAARAPLSPPAPPDKPVQQAPAVVVRPLAIAGPTGAAASLDDGAAKSSAATPPATGSAPVARTPQEPGIDGASATHPALAAMLSGHDPIVAAVDDLSARLGVACRFTPGEAESLADAAASVRISHSGRTLGWLRAPGVDRSIVEQEGAKIAGWILLAAQHDQLRRAAFTDELTGAFNRRYFNRFLAAAMDQAKAKRHTVTLLVFDIDNFKIYNDKYSHAAGDEILVEAVRLLTSVIRPSDRVCRVGGDEFAVIFHDPEGPRNPGVTATTPQSIAQIAVRFQKQICAHRFPKLLDEAPGTLTISGGMATFPWDGATPEELLARADELAMQSKRQGKNSITFGPGAAKVCQIGEEGKGVEA